MRLASVVAAFALLALATPSAAEDAAPKAAKASPDLSKHPSPPALDPWEARRLPWYSPSTLEYQAGMPAPPGYTLVRRRHRDLLIAGAALFGTSYVASILTAATVIGGHDRHRSEVAPLFAPIVGPWITLATSRDARLSDPDRRTNGVLAIIDGVTQLTGAALLIAGWVLREPVLVRTRESYGVSLVPEVVVGPGYAGMIVHF